MAPKRQKSTMSKTLAGGKKAKMDSSEALKVKTVEKSATEPEETKKRAEKKDSAKPVSAAASKGRKRKFSEAEPETQGTNSTEQNGNNVVLSASEEEKNSAPEKTGRRGRPGKIPKNAQIENKAEASEENTVAKADLPTVKNGEAAQSSGSSTTATKGKSTSKKVNASEALKKINQMVEDSNSSAPEEPDHGNNTENEETDKDQAADAADFSCQAKTKDGRSWNLKITCWNVGGLRSWFKKKGQDYVTSENPDVFVVQETKVTERDLTDEMRNISGYNSYFQHTDSKKGYAGVAMYTKIKPLNVTFGIGVEKFDNEGRLITAEFEKFYLISAYVPNSSRGLVRLPYRQEWNQEFLKYIKALDAKKPVICCGDLNVAHNEIDLANPKTNKKTAGFTEEERRDFTELLENGFTDAFRMLYPDKHGVYTFWSNMRGARGKNIGWRLDYFVVSKRMEKDVCDVAVRSDVTGSDHCPVTLFAAVE